MAAFTQLQPGQLARVPRMHAQPGEQPPPIVQIESEPILCGDGSCDDLTVSARNPVSGRGLIYHRPPDFEVEVWATRWPPAVEPVLEAS